jgi:YegS/Rv2252/BmrU family lipid kinase
MSCPGPIAVVLNAAASAAARHQHIDSELSDLFSTRGCEARVVTVGSGETLTDVARHAATHASVVVAAGGDGTVSSVAAGIIGSRAALGVLPLGTLNHFAKDLRIPLDLDQAVDVITGGHRQQVDVGEVNERIFVNNCSIGVYPDIVRERNELGNGHTKWLAMAVATFRVLRRFDGVTVRVDVCGRQQQRHTPFVFVGNNEYVIEGTRLGTRASIEQGQLFVYLAPRARVHDLPVLLAKALIGRARHSGAFEIVAAKELTIDARRMTVIDVAVDGEIVKMTTPLVYRTRPGSLQVVAPPA